MMRLKQRAVSKCLAFVLCLNSIAVFAIEGAVHFSCVRRQVTVLNGNKGFRTTEHGYGSVTKGPADLGVMYSSQQELISVEITYRTENGRLQRSSIKDGRDRSAVGSIFFSDDRVKLFMIEPTVRFDMHTALTCKETMMLARVPLRWWAPADTLITEIILPDGMRLYIDRPIGYRGRLSIDSSTVQGGRRYVFSAIDHGTQGSTSDTRLLAADRLGGIRIMVTSGTTVNDPHLHFNNWMADLAEPVMGLGEATTAVAEEIMATYTEPYERMQAVFDLVRSKIVYIAIEDGLNAFRPRPAEATWTALKGDCKDMAMLTCDLLQAIGIKSYLAVSSTLAHGADLDFPALSSGDHMICVAKLDGTWYFLDATEDACPVNRPSQHIQGRKVFLFSKEGHLVLDVPVVPPARNRTRITFDATIDGQLMTGRLRLVMNGMSVDEAGLRGQKENELYLTERISSMGRNWIVDSLRFSRTEDTLVATATIKAPGNITIAGGKRYISQKAFPFPHRWPTNITDGFDLPIYQALDREVVVTLQAEDGLHLAEVQSIAESAGPVSFTWTMERLSDGRATIRYHYVDRNVIHDARSADDYNKVNGILLKTLNSSLIDATK